MLCSALESVPQRPGPPDQLEMHYGIISSVTHKPEIPKMNKQAKAHLLPSRPLTYRMISEKAEVKGSHLLYTVRYLLTISFLTEWAILTISVLPSTFSILPP